MLTAPQAPASPLYYEVRSMQLRTPQAQPFAMPFLLFVYEKALEQVFADLPKKYHKQVDALLMLNTYIIRADCKATLTGLEVETLTDVLAETSHLVKWE